MKFLVLTLCVYAASAAVPAFRGNQPWQYSKAQAAVPVFNTVTKPIEAAVQTVFQPAVVAKNIITGNSDANAPIIRMESDTNGQGFNYAYETGNGISATATGTLRKSEDNAVNVLVIQGGYRYEGPDGPVEVTYTADENGYHPKSNLLPVAPPVPEAILRSLEYIAQHPQPIETVKKF